MMRFGRSTLAVLAALLLLLAACGGDDETVADDGASDGGELVIGGDLDVPDFFPSDFYLPDGISVKSVSNDPGSDMIALTGTFEGGDPEAIQADVVAGLRAAGYELLSNDDIAVFVKNGVGRVRVRTREFLGELTLTVDIDTWTDAQLDELRGILAEQVTVAGRATATFGGETFEAEGECFLEGANRTFIAGDVSISVTIDERQDPAYVYADITTRDGKVFTLDADSDAEYQSSAQRLSASGEMVEFNEGSGNVKFEIVATCDA
jgi:hypothetical protein